MAGMLTHAHTKRLEALHRLRHTLQGEPEAISLLKRDVTNALVELFSIDHGWSYGDADSRGNKLPPAVMFELQVAEELITATDMNQIAAIKHGQQIFQIVAIAPGEPGIFPPVGTDRFWRFWLAPLEATL